MHTIIAVITLRSYALYDALVKHYNNILFYK